MIFGVERLERRKRIKGYGGRYSIGDMGNVFSGENVMSIIQGKYVNLSYRGRTDRLAVAYLVARAFIPNQEGRPYVVHRDGDTSNNRVENLAWSELKEHKGGRKPSNAVREVLWYDLNGNALGKFQSISEATKKTGVARSLIRNCAEGRAKRAKQWIFRYA